MNKKAFLLALCFTLLSESQMLAQHLVHYIANEGVLLQCGEKKILIDALFDNYYDSYAYPSPQLVEHMNVKKAPYEAIALFLSTHVHRDHFYSKMVTDFLIMHKETHFIGTAQARDSLALISPSSNDISPRITSYPKKPGWHLFNGDGINVRATYVRHGGERNYGIENLIFLVETDGKKIIHLGDAEMDPKHFSALGLADQNIDLALVPYWFLAYPPGIKILKNDIKPKKIIGIHYPKVGDPKSLKLIRENFNNAVIFMNTGEEASF